MSLPPRERKAEAGRRMLFRSGMGSFALRAVNALAAASLTILMARGLGPSGYGVYTYALALVMLLNVPTQGGLPILVVRETAAALAHMQIDRVYRLWRWATAITLGLALTVALVGITVGWLFRAHLEPVAWNSFLLALLLVPLIVLGNLCGAALRGVHRVLLGQWPEYLLRPALLLLAILAYRGFAGDTMRADVAVGLHTLAAAVALMISAPLLWRARPQRGRPVAASADDTPSTWLSSMIPLTLLSAMQMILQYTDLVMLGFFRSSETVGLYRVAAQASLCVSFGLLAVNLIVAPQFARDHAKGDMARLQQVTTLSARLVLLLTLPVTLVFLMVAEPIVTFVFGAAYGGSGTALGILAIGQLCNAAFGSVVLLLNMTGHERDTVRGLSIGVVVNALLNLALIPLFGINGAAAATALTLLIWNVLLWRAVRRRLGIASTALGLRVAR